MGDDGLLGSFVLHMRYDIGWRAAFCGGWMIPCALLLLGTLGLIWFRQPREWHTQYNQLTGQRTVGMKTLAIGWSIFWFAAPVLTFIGYTVGPAIEWLTGHAWIFPVVACVGALIAVGIIGWRAWMRRRAEDAEMQRQAELVPLVAPQPYSQPYGQWSDNGQVMR